MNVKSIENIAVNQQKMTIEIDSATFKAAVDKAFKKAAPKISIPGFRKGKAPRAIVEKMYGEGAFYDDALNALIPEIYPEAIKDYDKVIVSRPEFNCESIDDNGVVLTATFFTKPDADINDYLGIAVTKNVVAVTEDEIDAEIAKVQQRNSRMVEITDRAAQMEDTVNIDFCGSVDGVEFAGGKAEGHELKLGSGQFIPGFEDQIVGKTIGESFDVNVTFPEDYHAEELKGKAAVFACKLNAIKYTELPALDDDFAADVSEYDTFAEYRESIKNTLTEAHTKRADADVEEQLIKAIDEKLVCEIPECMYDNETENFLQDFENRLRMQGLDLDTYFKYTGLDLEGLKKQMRPDAEKQVKTRLALETIAKKENIVVSEEEINAEYARLASAYNMEEERVRAVVSVEGVTEDLKVKAAVALIKEKAVVTETSAAE